MTEPRLDFLPAQAALYRSKAPIVCYVGGFGSGKTEGLWVKAMKMAQDNAGIAPVAFVEPTFSMARDVAVRTARRWFERHNIEFFFHGTNFELRWLTENGYAEVLFRSADRPERLAGLNLAGALLDEAAQCSEDAAVQLLARMGRVEGAVNSQLVLGGTPDGGLDSWFARWAETEPQEGTELIRAKTIDNRFLPDGYVDRLAARFDEQEAAAYLDGRFIARGGQVYTRFDRDRHVAPAPDFGSWQIWADFNVVNMAWLIIRETRGVFHVVDELVSDQPTNTEEWAEKAVAWFANLPTPVRPGRVRVYCDASGKARRTSAQYSDIVLLQRAGFDVRAMPYNPPVRDRVASVQEALRTDRLLFDPQARESIRSISQQGRDKYGDPCKASGLDHAADAIGYGIFGQAPITAPRGNAVSYA